MKYLNIYIKLAIKTIWKLKWRIEKNRRIKYFINIIMLKT